MEEALLHIYINSVATVQLAIIASRHAQTLAFTVGKAQLHLMNIILLTGSVDMPGHTIRPIMLFYPQILDDTTLRVQSRAVGQAAVKHKGQCHQQSACDHKMTQIIHMHLIRSRNPLPKTPHRQAGQCRTHNTHGNRQHRRQSHTGQNIGQS